MERPDHGGHAPARRASPCCAWSPGSPAAQAGLQPGDVVLGADGQPIKRTADLLAAVAAKKPGDELVLQVQGAAPGSSPRGVDLVLGATAREIPLFDPQLVYNKVMMDLRSVVEGYPGTEAAAYAALNLALCAMHFSDYAGAHEYLQKAKAELPDAARPLARHRALLPRPRAREARLPPAGGRGLPRGGGGEGRDADRQRRPGGRRPGRAAGGP